MGGETSLRRLEIVCSGDKNGGGDKSQDNRKALHFTRFLENDGNKLDNDDAGKDQKRGQVAVAGICGD